MRALKTINDRSSIDQVDYSRQVQPIRAQASWYRRRPAIAGIYGAIVLGAAFTFLFLEPPANIQFWYAAFDVGHACLFGILTFVVLHVIDMAEVGDRSGYRLGAAVALVMLAGCSELVQRFQPTRDPSLDDALRDTAGIAFTYLVYFGAPARAGTGRLRRRLVVTVITLLVLSVVVPFALIARAYVERDRVFPTLCLLADSRWERLFVRVIGGVLVADGRVGRGSVDKSYRQHTLLLKPGHRYVGLALDEPYPDWRGYRTFVLTASSDVDDPLELFVRIRDRASNGEDEDSFLQSFRVTRTPQTFNIALAAIEESPRGRRMDLGSIGSVTMFLVDLRAPVTLNLDHVGLE